jgi:two-component system alkaline phosphatase synthesis response regulator PhoP
MTEKKRILVVDDEPDFCSIVQGQLEKEGFEVDVAYNGVEGLEKVHANPPYAIVLVVMMPDMDG